METPFFAPLAHAVPAAAPRPKGKGAVVFWSVFVVGALVACFTYIPMSELSQKSFVDASARRQIWFFPQRMNNAVMLWAVLNGLFGFVLFFGSYHLFGKHHGARSETWGAKTSLGELTRTFILAFTIFGFFFLLLAMYAPIFFIFFLSNSLRVNGGMRFEGVPEWRSMLLGGVANTLGLFLIQIVQYAVFFATGTVYWTDGWLYVNLLFAVVPMMFILPLFNRYFFLLTGRIYLGPMTTCLIFIMILLTNTVCYLPL